MLRGRTPPITNLTHRCEGGNDIPHKCERSRVSHRKAMTGINICSFSITLTKKPGSRKESVTRRQMLFERSWLSSASASNATVLLPGGYKQSMRVPDSLAGTHKLSFFVLRRVTVGGRELSLHAYEKRGRTPFL